MNSLGTVFLFVAAGSAAAQQVTMQPAVVVPLTTTASFGGVVDTDTANALPPFGLESLVTAPGGSARASTEYWVPVTVGPVGGQQLHVLHGLVVSTPGTPALAAATADLRLDLVATLPTSVRITVDVMFDGTPGAPLPSLTVDIGNNGTIEHQGIGTFAPGTTWAIGTAALPVRVQISSQLAIAGNSNLYVIVSVLPGHPTTVSRQVSGCGPAATPHLAVVPGFDASVTFTVGPLPWTPVLVLGLGMQPVLLPPSGALSPCLLLPSADILVAMVPGPIGYPQTTLPLPPAVRPVTFWAQTVLVAPQGLYLTDAYRVDAL